MANDLAISVRVGPVAVLGLPGGVLRAIGLPIAAAGGVGVADTDRALSLSVTIHAVARLNATRRGLAVNSLPRRDDLTPG